MECVVCKKPFKASFADHCSDCGAFICEDCQATAHCDGCNWPLCKTCGYDFDSKHLCTDCRENCDY